MKPSCVVRAWNVSVVSKILVYVASAQECGHGKRSLAIWDDLYLLTQGSSSRQIAARRAHPALHCDTMQLR
ncbi:hypothetical protein FOA52_011405 [Chlamydomonas sp. UWO 241]|nr:hypothetical protein FOA52_011405 [Chlamydomonas sp. UWO 241]